MTEVVTVRQVLPELLERIYATGTVEDAAGEAGPAFPESLPRAHAEALAGLVRDGGFHRTLETGMGYGISTLAIACAGPEVRHVAIDPSQHDAFRGIGLLNASRAGVEDRVTLMEDRSDVALPRLAGEGL